MLGDQERWQEDLFVVGTLRDLIPEEHILRRVDRVMDFSWVVDEVRDCYSETHGRPSIDPEAALRLMLAGYFQGIVHDRKLLREAQVNLAIRWFAGYRLDEKLPHHSSLTRIRQRWGEERFRRIFLRTLAACQAAGLVDGETVHVDATLIRADVSWESLHVERVLEANAAEAKDADDSDDGNKSGPPRERPKGKKRSRTDPDATLSRSKRDRVLEPSYKQHIAVDDRAGVIVDVAVTTGEATEGRELLPQLDRVEAQTGTPIKRVTADQGYGHARNYRGLEERGIEAVIPPQKGGPRGRRWPVSRFKYDAKHDVVRCPRGKRLRRASRTRAGWAYRTAARDCRGCPWRASCIGTKQSVRSVVLADGYAALLRARRRHRRRRADDWDWYNRHRWRAEGVQGEEKTQHGLRRAVRRGRWNVAIQSYLTAAVVNLKRLAAFCRLLRVLLGRQKAAGGVWVNRGRDRRIPGSRLPVFGGIPAAAHPLP